MPPSGKAPSLHVLARGRDWVAVAKPPGLLVHRSALAAERTSALQLLRDQLGQWVYPVHRLDRAASGCLLFALTSEATARLQAAMSDEGATKTYLALVRGAWPLQGVLAHDDPMKDDGGVLRSAQTHIEVLGHSTEPRCSLVRARPLTGRYHQVRRHLARLDHPILGDTKHGDGRENRRWRADHGLPHLALHCASLELPLEAGLAVRCPLFDDLHPILAKMPWWTGAATQEPALRLSTLPLGD